MFEEEQAMRGKLIEFKLDLVFTEKGISVCARSL